jgi:hypothetical protein
MFSIPRSAWDRAECARVARPHTPRGNELLALTRLSAFGGERADELVTLTWSAVVAPRL